MDPDLPLVPRLRRGEMDALRQLYERHGARVHRLCLRLLGCAADAEDASQEVFLRLFERADGFDGRSRLSTWLYRVTVNLCLHRLERDRVRAAGPLPEGDEAPTDPGASPIERLARRETQGRLVRLLERLSPEHRAILLLREVEDLSYRDIAAALDLPEGTVMSRLSRARQSLARLALAEPRAPSVPTVPASSLRP